MRGSYLFAEPAPSQENDFVPPLRARHPLILLASTFARLRSPICQEPCEPAPEELRGVAATRTERRLHAHVYCWTLSAFLGTYLKRLRDISFRKLMTFITCLGIPLLGRICSMRDSLDLKQALFVDREAGFFRLRGGYPIPLPVQRGGPSWARWAMSCIPATYGYSSPS